MDAQRIAPNAILVKKFKLILDFRRNIVILQIMNIFEIIRNLPENILGSGWITFVSKGDKFNLNGENFEVVCNTPKTFRIKSDKRKLSFKKYNGCFAREGKFGDFVRNVEGNLMVDCINELNQFHEVSDFFKIYQKNIDNL